MSKPETSSRRPLVPLAVVSLLGLFAINSWTISEMLASQRRLEDASSELSLSQRRVLEIQRLKYRPTVASLKQESDSDMTRRVEVALANAGLSSEQLLENKPQPISELPNEATLGGKTNYKQRLTTIKLEGVSLQQLVQFCENVEDPKEGLMVRDLDFLPNLNNASPGIELWTVTLTLTQLIFSPTS